jgi:hypothetical protein
MSFHVEFHARSRAHANKLLEIYKASMPAPVHAFVQASIDNLPPLKEGATRYIKVYANGHLCDTAGSYTISKATIEVTPADIPD